MKTFSRSGPVAVVAALAILGSATAVAAKVDLGTFTVQWGNGVVYVDQSGITTVGDVQIAYQTLEFVAGDAVAPVEEVVEEAATSVVSIRSGLTFSGAELAVWRDRSVNGPFKSAGDAWTNSPGDWDRLVTNSEKFLTNPRDGRYAGPRSDGTCVQKFDPGPPYSTVGRLRDAAFVGLVTGDRKFEAAIREELLWHAAQPGLAFGNPSVWCAGVVNDVNPGFEIASFMTELLYAYDYLGPVAFSPAERTTLDAWFLGAGRYFQKELDDQFVKLFDVRELDRHVVKISLLNNPACTNVTWLGGPANCHLHRMYNNRRATMARFVGAVGVAVDNDSLRRSAKLFAIEFVKFSVFPDGTFGELDRWRSDLPDLGWAYATQTLGPVVTIADLLARDGDTSLYDFVTSDGALGTQGGSKSILFASQALGRYIDGTYKRYGTDDPAAVGSGTLIDGEHLNWKAVHDIVVTPANRYYKDPYLRSVYQRSGPGMRPYPSAVASNGPNQIWTGEHGTLPAVLFMYGQLEDLAYPVG